MISHALTIVMNELDKHFVDNYSAEASQVKLGNPAEGFVKDGIRSELLYLSLVNIKEEKTLKNLPNYVKNETTLKVTYENPPVFLNFLIMMTAPHADYTNALTILSRTIRFFQSNNLFTQDSVAPASITTASVPFNALDQLESFKLIFDLYSPSMEEVNHLWGTLGGKQYPFVLYMLRMLDLKFKTVPSENRLIAEVINKTYHLET